MTGITSSWHPVGSGSGGIGSCLHLWTGATSGSFFGKMSVVLILLSAITWAPGLLLFLFQSYLEGFGWFSDNLWIASDLIHISAAKPRLMGCWDCGLNSLRRVVAGCHLGRVVLRSVVVQVNDS